MAITPNGLRKKPEQTVPWGLLKGESDAQRIYCACQRIQVELYRNQAEQLAKNFIDVSLEQLVDSMRASIVEEVMVTKIDEVKSTVVQKSDELKPGFLKNVGNHLLGGLASAFVALSLYGVFESPRIL